MKNKILLLIVFGCCLKLINAQPGQPDILFGKNGTVRADLGADAIYTALSRQVLVQADGGVFVLFESSGLTFIEKKYTDGSPDSTYGHAGYSSSVAIINAHAALQKDGKIVVAGAARSANTYSNFEDDFVYDNYDFALARFNTDGSLDQTFDADGRVTSDFSGYYDAVNAVAIQNDGKIIVAGFTPIIIVDDDYNHTHFSDRIALARYNTDGSPDKTFNGTGRLLTELTISSAADNFVALAPDEKIVAAGYGSKGLIIARYNTDGSLDNTFTGTEPLLKDGAYFSTKALAIQNNGKIVVAGFWQKSNTDFVLVRFNANGKIDSTFNKTGIQNTDFRTYDDYVSSIAIQSDQKIVAAGSASNGLNNAFAVARYNTDGSADNTFDTDGKKMTFIGSNDVYAVSVAIQSNAKIIAAGYKQLAASTDLAFIRYNKDGSLDNTFNKSGTLIDRFKQKRTSYTKSVAQKDGKIVCVGKYWTGPDYNPIIARYNADGSLDNTFSSDGVQVTDFILSDIKIQQDGKIAGSGTVLNGSNADFAVVRYNSDGSLDNTFSGDGKVTADFSNGDAANAMAIQNDGKIVVAGTSDNQFTIIRYNTDGSLDKSFSGDGKQTVIITDQYQDTAAGSYAYLVTIQSNGKIVVAGRADFDEAAFAIVRLNINGSLDGTLGGDGVQTTDFNTFFPYRDQEYGGSVFFNSITILDNGKIMTGGYADFSARYYYDDYCVIALFNPDGSRDNTFAENGIKILYFNNNSRGTSIAKQDNGKILISGNLYQNDEYRYGDYAEIQKGFAFARLTKEGNPDSTFGTNGIQYAEPVKNAEIQSITVAGNKLYAVGYAIDINEFGLLSRYILTAPFIKLITPADNQVYAAPATVNLKAIASDEDGAISNVKFYNGSTYLKTVFTAPYNYTVGNLAPGKYTFTAKATDNGGLQSVSQPVKILVLATAANKAPVVSITTPANNAYYTAPATLTLNAAATDADGTITKVQFYRGSTLLATDSTSPYTCTISNLAAGNYTFIAKATDNKGLASSSSSVSVAVSVTQNKAPVVNVTSPVNDVVYNVGDTIYITAAAKDLEGIIGSILIYNNGTLIGYIYSSSNVDTYTVTLTDAAPGSYSIVAKATDDQGASGSSPSITFQVAAKTNKAPTVSITSPANNATFTAPATIKINASAADADGTVSNVKFYNGTTYLKTVFAGPYTYTLSNLPQGTYSLTAKATDNNGAQTTSEAIKVTVKAAAIVSSKHNAETNDFDTKTTISLKAWPNPANKTLTVSAIGLQQNKVTTISILSATGVVMKTLRVNNPTTQLDVSSLTSGVYTIKLLCEDKVLYKQFVKL